MMSYTSNFNTLLITREETSSSCKFSSCFSRKPMAFQQSLFLWLAAAVLLMLANAESRTIAVNIGFVSPWNTTDTAMSSLGKELASVYKLAVEQANNDGISTKSQIRLSTNFTELLFDEANCKNSARRLVQNNTFVGIVGGLTSSCSMTIQQRIKDRGSKLSQISYRSTIAKLADKLQYPTLFRTSASDANQAQTLADVIRHFRWRKVSLLCVSDIQGEGLIDEIRSRLHNYGIKLVESITFKPGESNGIIDDRLMKIKNADTRVNLLLAFGDDALRVIKRAKLKKMTGEGWVWIGSDGVAASLLHADKSVSKAAQGIVTVSPKVPDGERLLHLIMSWFDKATKEYPGVIWSLKLPGISPYGAQVYDAVLLYYKALDKLARRNVITENSTHEDIRASLLVELKTFRDWKSGIYSITGGRAFFDIDGNTFDAPASYDILNFVDGHFVDVGSWNKTSTGLEMSAGRIIWPGGTRKTPTDRGTPGKPLFKIGFIAPLHSGLGILSEHGKELVSAAKVAVDIINADRNQQVEIDLKVMDEGLDGTISCKEAAENLLAYSVVAVVGAYRSSCSIAVSSALESSNTPVISYASAASILSDKRKHPYFFRVVPSDHHESKALLELLSKYDFKGAGTLSSEDLAPLEITDKLERMLRNASRNVGVSSKVPLNADSTVILKALEKIRRSGSRVNVISSIGQSSAELLNAIRNAEMIGKGWVWLATSGVASRLMTTESELAKAMDGLLGIGPSSGEGSVYLNFIANWLEKDSVKYPGIIHRLVNPTSLPYTCQVYDAVNGLALSLSDLIARKSVTYQTRQKVIRLKLFQKLKTYKDLVTGYPSSSGTKSVYFDENQDGPPILDILNLVDAKWKVIGGYSGHGDRISFTQDPTFPGGSTVPVVGAGKSIYKVAAFFPKHVKLGPLSELGYLWESALRAAVDWLNENKSFTIGFKMETYSGGLDEQDCATVARGLPDDIDLVIGEYRSACTAAIYHKVERRKIPIISYGATSATLSNKIVYPYLFRTCPSNEYQSMALNELVAKLKWEKLGIISERNAYGSGLLKSFVEKLRTEDIWITAAEDFRSGKAERITKNILSLKSSGTGVNVIISQPSDAERVFQEAFEQRMTGKGWTWLGSDGAVSSTFTKSQHLQHAMQGMVGFRPKGGSGELYSKILKQWGLRGTRGKIPYVAQVIDALLAPAFALQRLHSKKHITEKTKRTDARNLMARELQNMKNQKSGFSSATGTTMYFDENQDPPGIYDLVNLNGESWVTVGSFHSNQLHITRNIVWPGGTVDTPPSNQPLDHQVPVSVEKTSKELDGALLAVAVIFGVFGALVLGFMAYIIHRVKHRHLYMQSDVSSGGLFSVLYGHRQNNGDYARPETNVVPTGKTKVEKDTPLADESET